MTESDLARLATDPMASSPCFSAGVAASVSVDRDFCTCPSVPRAVVNVSFALLASGATWPSTSRKNFWASTMATRVASRAARAESAAAASLEPKGATWPSAFFSSCWVAVTRSFKDMRVCFNSGTSRRVFTRLSMPNTSESSASSSSFPSSATARRTLWTKDMLTPGMVVKVVGIPSRAPGSHGITNAKFTRPDGSPIGPPSRGGQGE
jgi:hypothetical protein